MKKTRKPKSKASEVKPSFKWKKEIFSSEADFWVARIPSLDFAFFVLHERATNFVEATLLFHENDLDGLILKTGKIKLEAGKKYCEDYFERFVKKVEKYYS